MVRQQPSWSVDVVTAAYGSAERHLPRYAEDLLTEVPDSVNVLRVGDPAYGSGEQGALAVRAVRTVKRAAAWLLDTVPEVGAYVKSRMASIPDPQISWNSAVLQWASNSVLPNQYDLIYVSSPPYSTAVLGARLKKLLGVPLVVDIKDDWAPRWKDYPPARREEEQALERQVIEVADEVILVTPASLESYRQRYPEYSHFNLVANGVDLENYADVDLDGMNPSKFKVTYAGSLGGHNRSPINFFKAFRRLLNDPDVDPDSCIASFPEHMLSDFWNAVSSLGLDQWVESVPILPMGRFKQHLAESAVLLAINYYGETTLIPGKLYDYWAVGRPILLVEKPGAATRLVEQYNLGLTADPDDVSDIYCAIRHLYGYYQDGRSLRLSREGLMQFSREALTRSFCSIVERQLEQGCN